MGDWRVSSVRGDPSSLGSTSTYVMVHKETGEIREVCVNSGDKDYELEQVGEELGESVDDDDDDDDD